MKIKVREVSLLLLPCLGLLVFGMMFNQRPAPQAAPALQRAARAYISIQPPVRAASWAEDGGLSVRAALHFDGPHLAQRPRVRWYYNSRIEGTLNGRPHIFYSSGGYDPHSCLSSSSYSSRSPRTHVIDEAFWLRRLPSGAQNLTFHVQAVALEGAWAQPQEMPRGELLQARRSARLLGYASNSMPLLPPKSKSSPDRASAERPSPQLLPYAIPTPRTSSRSARPRVLKYLQVPEEQST